MFNYLDSTVTETQKTSNGSYVQMTYNEEQQSYELLYREQRYSQPVLLEHSLSFEDAEKLLEDAKTSGVSCLLTEKRRGADL